jgi:hypothetical protein
VREELERAIRELEAKLPNLRHLIAEAELQLTLSEDVAAVAARFLRLITQTDEVASQLRRALLGGTSTMPHAAQHSDAPTEAALAEIAEDLSRVAKELKTLEREMHERDEPSDDPPGGSPVPAVPRGPSPTRTPGSERTYEEAAQPPRNP